MNLERMECMTNTYEKKDLWGKSGADTLRKRFLNPAVSCHEKHFNSETNRFYKKWTNINHTLFIKQCCNGKGIQCVPNSYIMDSFLDDDILRMHKPNRNSEHALKLYPKASQHH
jgi:hypothetical protein